MFTHINEIIKDLARHRIEHCIAMKHLTDVDHKNLEKKKQEAELVLKWASNAEHSPVKAFWIGEETEVFVGNDVLDIMLAYDDYDMWYCLRDNLYGEITGADLDVAHKDENGSEYTLRQEMLRAYKEEQILSSY